MLELTRFNGRGIQICGSGCDKSRLSDNNGLVNLDGWENGRTSQLELPRNSREELSVVAEELLSDGRMISNGGPMLTDRNGWSVLTRSPLVLGLIGLVFLDKVEGVSKGGENWARWRRIPGATGVCDCIVDAWRGMRCVAV